MELVLPLATCHCTFHCVMILLSIILANKFSLSLSVCRRLVSDVGESDADDDDDDDGRLLNNLPFTQPGVD